MKVETFEFASPAWVDLLQRLMTEGLADADLSGIEYSSCEELTDPPPHLLRPGASTIGWHSKITDGRFEFHDGPIEEATVKWIADYQTWLPMARLVIGSDPEAGRQAQEIIRRGIADGTVRVVGDPSVKPAVLAGLNLHDHMARRTS